MIPRLFSKVETEFTRVNCARLRETLLNTSVWLKRGVKKSCSRFPALSAFLESHERPERARSGHHS